jgi:prophage DNA circulation protein
MPTYLQSLPKARFDGIEFPVKRYEVSGGIRKHTHEYPHSPGGAIEKLGRSLYQFNFTAIFDVRLSGYGDNLLPGDLSDLRDRWEEQITSELFIPHIGPVQALSLKWREVVEPSIQSGVVVELEFEEDQAQAFLVNGLIQISSTTLQNAGEQFDQEFAPLLAGGTVSATAPTRITAPPAGTTPRALSFADSYTQLRQRDVDALNQIRSGYQRALTIAEQPTRYADQVLQAADAVVTSCAQAYERIRILKNPLMYSRAWAYKRLWYSAKQLRESVAGQTARILFYRAEIDTTISAVSRAIYGDASYASQIMQLNAIPDPFMIRKGTILRYYDPSTQQRAA